MLEKAILNPVMTSRTCRDNGCSTSLLNFCFDEVLVHALRTIGEGLSFVREAQYCLSGMSDIMRGEREEETRFGLCECIIGERQLSNERRAQMNRKKLVEEKGCIIMRGEREEETRFGLCECIIGERQLSNERRAQMNRKKLVEEKGCIEVCGKGEVLSIEG